MQTYLKLNNEAYESFMDYIRLIFQQASSYGSKSSILSALMWIIFGFLGLFILASIFAPMWVSILLAVVVSVFLILFIYTYLRCLHKGNTDDLRSETFVISKLAIEKHIPEDSLNGKLPSVNPVNTKSLSGTNVDSGEGVNDEA